MQSRQPPSTGLSAIAAKATGRRITDLTCGYKLFRKELFDKLDLREERFGFETELMFRALGVATTSFTEEPVSYSPRKGVRAKRSASPTASDTAKVLKFSLAGKNWISALTLTLLIAFMTGTMLSEKHWREEQGSSNMTRSPTMPGYRLSYITISH